MRAEQELISELVTLESRPGITESQSHQRLRSKMLYRLVVMGSSRVGKTALINRFLYDSFPVDYKPTVEEMHRGEYAVSNTTVLIDILDTSGMYSFPAMRALSIQKADGFVLVYAIDDANSFEEIRSLRDQIIRDRQQVKHMVQHSPPIIVVANKNDLRETGKLDCLVHRETAETTVCIDWELAFVESSAKDNYNVNRVFQEVLSRVDNVKFNPLDLTRRYSCPSSMQRTSGVTRTNFRNKHLSKRHSCSLS